MANKHLKILIIDRDHSFLNIAENKLASRGFTVIKASFATEATKILKYIHFDSILVSSKEDELLVLNFVKPLKRKPTILSTYSNQKGLDSNKFTHWPTLCN